MPNTGRRGARAGGWTAGLLRVGYMWGFEPQACPQKVIGNTGHVGAPHLMSLGVNTQAIPSLKGGPRGLPIQGPEGVPAGLERVGSWRLSLCKFMASVGCFLEVSGHANFGARHGWPWPAVAIENRKHAISFGTLTSRPTLTICQGSCRPWACLALGLFLDQEENQTK